MSKISIQKKKEYDKQYRIKNAERKKQLAKIYYAQNKEVINQKRKDRYIKNRSQELIKMREWRQNNKDFTKKIDKEKYEKNKNNPEWLKIRNEKSAINYQINKSIIRLKQKNKRHTEAYKLKRKNKYHTNIQYQLKENIISLINHALKKNSKSARTEKLIGCTIPELKFFLESKFSNGMTWDNKGNGVSKWHIDHIIPKSYFDLSKVEEQHICFNYRNLQPLWSTDNLKKYTKLPDNYQEIIKSIRGEISDSIY